LTQRKKINYTNKKKGDLYFMSSAQVFLTVTTFNDENDGSASVGTGLSLRDAILQARANPGKEYIIQLGAGTYNLAIQGNEDSIFSDAPGNVDDIVLRTGDLDVDRRITIVGISPQETIIDASSLGDRIFHVRSGGFLNVENVTIQGGSLVPEAPSPDGGGIYVESGAGATLKNTIVRDNDNNANNGGGIGNDGVIEITDSWILDNSSGDDAGGIYNTGTMTITNSTISGNYADAAAIEILEAGGGGIYTTGGVLVIRNSTISGNITGDTGGGILHEGSAQTTIINSTIVDNTSQAGGGILSVESSASPVVLKNTIVAGNKNFLGNVPIGDIEGYFSDDSSYNLIGDGNGILINGVNNNLTGDLLNPLDPKLGPLQDNGGLTPTHAVLEGSPVINAGNNNYTQIRTLGTLPLVTDQIGSARIIGGTVDIGSVESSFSSQPENPPTSGVENPPTDDTTNPPTDDTTNPPTSGLDDLDDPVYRFYNPVSKGHFFTASTSERDTLINNPSWGYVYEGSPFKVSTTSDDSLLPVYRFYNPTSGGHFFTTNEAEKNTVLNNPQYNFEGIGFYTYGANAQMGSDVYRFYNSQSQGHFFTASEAEKNTVLNNPQWGYSFEGVGFEVIV
jgi:hypothetical protein